LEGWGEGWIAQEIVDDHESALEQFRLIGTDLDRDPSEKVNLGREALR
jgi:hypothetical protein